MAKPSKETTHKKITNRRTLQNWKPIHSKVYIHTFSAKQLGVIQSLSASHFTQNISNLRRIHLKTFTPYMPSTAKVTTKYPVQF
jgi:hypothetical protein